MKHTVRIMCMKSFYTLQISFLYTVKLLYQDHPLDCPNVAFIGLRPYSGQSQSWSLVKGTLDIETNEKNNPTPGKSVIFHGQF